jgi:hypothetical protein
MLLLAIGVPGAAHDAINLLHSVLPVRPSENIGISR